MLLDGGNLLVSDSARHSLVELAADGETVLRRIGSGERGRADGPAGGRRVLRAAGALPAAGARGRGRRLRPGGRRHRQPPAARRTAGHRRGGHGGRHRPAVALHGRRPRPRRALGRPLLPLGPGLVRRPGRSSPWPASTSSGGSTRSSGPPACTPAPPSRRCATARWPRRGWPSRPACRSRPTAPGSGWPTARPAPLRYVAERRPGHRRRAGAVRLRARRRAGRPGVAPASAGRVRAARRFGAGRRHVQRRGTPLRPRRPAQVSTVADGLAEPSDLVLTADGGVLVVESAGAPADPAGPGRADSAAGANTVDGPRHRTERNADRGGGRRGDPGRDLHAGAGAEAGRDVRAVDPAGGVGVPAGAAGRGGRHRHRAVPPAGARPPTCPAGCSR